MFYGKRIGRELLSFIFSMFKQQMKSLQHSQLESVLRILVILGWDATAECNKTKLSNLCF